MDLEGCQIISGQHTYIQILGTCKSELEKTSQDAQWWEFKKLQGQEANQP